MKLPALLLPALAALVVASPAYTQQEAAAKQAAVVGYVVDRNTRSPLDATVIELPEAGLRVLTDSQGRFALSGLQRGKHEVLVRRLGYNEYRTTWTLEKNLTTITIALGVQPIALEGVTAHGYTFAGEIERRRRSIGISSRTIARDLLQVTGARDAAEAAAQLAGVWRVPCPTEAPLGGDCALVRGRVISPTVYIDERRAFGLSELEMYNPRDLFLIEVYGGGSHIRAYTTWFVDREGRRGRRVLEPLFW